MSQQFVTFVPPPGPGALPAPPPPPVPPVPPAFADALAVRRAVFVDEQRCALANEQDADDARSCHWVAYASVARRPQGAAPADAAAVGEDRTVDGSADGPPAATQVPAATIRLVPPPHAPHPLPGSVDNEPSALERTAGARPTAWHDGREAYVKLGRLATLARFRGLGLGRLLVAAALAWAAAHAEALRGGPAGAVAREREREREVAEGLAGGGRETEWRGLVMVHAQRDVVPFYERLGFEVDPELGEWWEEHILHVGMWRRIALEK